MKNSIKQISSETKKEIYVSPESEVIRVKADDIITTSVVDTLAEDETIPYIGLIQPW